MVRLQVDAVRSPGEYRYMSSPQFLVYADHQLVESDLSARPQLSLETST